MHLQATRSPPTKQEASISFDISIIMYYAFVFTGRTKGSAKTSSKGYNPPSEEPRKKPPSHHKVSWLSRITDYYLLEGSAEVNTVVYG